jgi:hypothetical protein
LKTYCRSGDPIAYIRYPNCDLAAGVRKVKSSALL